MAQDKQELMDYILDHYEDPRNSGTITDADKVSVKYTKSTIVSHNIISEIGGITVDSFHYMGTKSHIKQNTVIMVFIYLLFYQNFFRPIINMDQASIFHCFSSSFNSLNISG